MAPFFINRPVFAIVIAIVIVLLGIVSIPSLPVAAYPDLVPPVVSVSANYLGGNAEDLEKTIAEPIEEQLVGLDHMLYFSSTSGNDGSVTIQVTFALGTNPDIAAVQTQNRVNIALPRLPPEVQRAGVTVAKVSSQFLIAVCLISTDPRYDALFLTNYAQINLFNQIDANSARSWSGATRIQRSLIDAGVGKSRPHGEAGNHRHRCQQRHSSPKTPESGRSVRLASHSAKGTELQYRDFGSGPPGRSAPV